MEARGVVKNFLRNWILGKKELMYKYCTKTWKFNHQSDEFRATMLKTFKIEDDKISANGTVADFRVILRSDVGSWEYSCRCIKEIEAYKPSPEGTWGIYPASFTLIKNFKDGR